MQRTRATALSTVWILVGFLLGLLGVPATAAADGPAVKPSIAASRPDAAVGDQFLVAVVLDHAEGWHVHTHDPKVPASWAAVGFEAIPTVVTLTGDGLRVGTPQWPKAKPLPLDLTGSGKLEPYEVFEGRAVVLIPVTVERVSGPTVSIKVALSFQACDERSCAFPEDHELTLDLPVATRPAAMFDAAQASGDFAGFKGSFAAAAVAPPTPPTAAANDAPAGVPFDFLGLFTINIDPAGAIGTLLIALMAAVAGFILNLTPCVLPVIPIKIMGLAQAAPNPARRMLLGGSMFAGVVSLWLAMGVLIALLQVIDSANSFFGNAYFTTGMGLFIIAMAFGMLGAFTVALPQAAYMLNPKQDSVAGAFAYGVVTAILGTPCFGPFMGAAMGWATQQSSATALLIFACVGLGMGLPYFVLAIRPKLVSWIPRTGPASELVKQVMGLMLLAAGAWLLGSGMLVFIADRPYLGPVLHYWFVASFLAMAAGWLVWRTFAITKSPARRAIFTLVGVGLAWAGWATADKMTSIERDAYQASGPANGRSHGLWRAYDPQAVDQAVAAGNVVVLEFTASWCATCKVLEATVLSRDDVRAALTAPGVVAFKVDVSSSKAIGRQRLAALGEKGIPLLAILGPGVSKPLKNTAYGPGWVIESIAKARGDMTSALPPSASVTPAR